MSLMELMTSTKPRFSGIVWTYVIGVVWSRSVVHLRVTVVSLPFEHQLENPLFSTLNIPLDDSIRAIYVVNGINDVDETPV